MICGRRTFIGLAAAAAASECAGVAGCETFDDNLSVFFSDPHVEGRDGASPSPTARRLSMFVDEVLSMRPLPKRVVCLGDLAMKNGHPEDYAAAAPILARLESAGVSLVFCMGNHDRRSTFAKAFPHAFEKSPVYGRCVSVTSLGSVDLIILDGLLGSDDRASGDAGPLPGGFGADQVEWLRTEMPRRTRPFIVASHFPLDDITLLGSPGEKFASLLTTCAPMCMGYVYGHLHRWLPSWVHGPWRERTTLRTLCLPSCGIWGDIGYVVVRTCGARASFSLEMRDFYFPREPANADDRLESWRLMVEELRGARCTFAHDKSSS